MESSARLFIEEPLPEGLLLAVASEHERRMVAGFGTASRRRERLMWRHIVRRELGEDVEIDYDPNGAPAIKNREVFIGVSHSDDFVAVIIGPNRCAIDIERLDRNFEHIAARYMRPEERLLSDDPRLPAVVWSAKETLYKYNKERGVDFLRDLHILEVDFAGAEVIGQIRDDEPIRMQMKFHLGNVVVYVG